MAKGSSSNAGTADFQASRPMSDAAREWLKTERGIDPEMILGKLPVGDGTTSFASGKSAAIFFGYAPGEWKARAFPGKDFRTNEGFEPKFWNLQAVLANPKLDRVYITEGELDACALVHAEISPDQVLAAPSANANLEYVGKALEMGLNRAKKIIWCGDQDDPGIKLRDQMAHLFGPAKFCFVNWPDGIKDANAMLKADGMADLYEMVTKGFLPWPTMGLYRLNDIPESTPLTQWFPGDMDNEPGWAGWSKRIYLAPGTLSVVTGHPGMGKSLMWTQLWQQIVKRYDLVVCVASFETRAKPHMRRQLRALHGRVLENLLTDGERNAADKWINDHYLFLIHPDRRPDLNWLLGQAEIAIVREGAKVVQIDPWNRLEASREKGESETDYIGHCLRRIYNFAVDLGVHVQIIAHPSKIDGWRRGGPPNLEDIAGSKHWDNMVDQGFVVHRPRLFDDKGNRDYYAELHHKKARFDELGYATKLGLEFDPDKGRFGPCDLKKKRKPQEDTETNTGDD